MQRYLLDYYYFDLINYYEVLQWSFVALFMWIFVFHQNYVDNQYNMWVALCKNIRPRTCRTPWMSKARWFDEKPRNICPIIDGSYIPLKILSVRNIHQPVATHGQLSSKIRIPILNLSDCYEPRKRLLVIWRTRLRKRGESILFCCHCFPSESTSPASIN
jgi:hypothetical protein